jgi:hypothetical protein
MQNINIDAYCPLLFKRGFLLTNEEINCKNEFIAKYILKYWKCHKIRCYNLYCEPTNLFNSIKDSNYKIIVLGKILDPINFISNPKIIIKNLADNYQKSFEKFLNYLDYLSGRFVIILFSKSRSFILNDAAGTRTIFYDISKESIIISSHSSLIAAIKDNRLNKNAKKIIKSGVYKSESSYLPGVLTPFQKIYILTPNTLIDINKGSVERFFPRERLDIKNHLSVDRIVEIANILETQIKLLSEKYELAVSLTGGIDSRLTLSSTRKYSKKILYYTLIDRMHKQFYEHLNDAKTAEKIAKLLELKYRKYIFPDEVKNKGFNDFKYIWDINTSFMRTESQRNLSWLLYNIFPNNKLHIKSSISEINTASYVRRGFNSSLFNIKPENLALLYGKFPKSNFVIEAFSKYINITKFKLKNIYNYNMSDLFYWEHRMGTWQSLQLIDFDGAQETIIPYNNRYLIKRMLAIPLDKRVNYVLYYKLIKHLWPDVLKIPINPLTFDIIIRRKIFRISKKITRLREQIKTK